MPIPASCPCCGKTGTVPEAYAGKIVRCKQCSTNFTVRGPAQMQAAPVPGADAGPLEDMPALLVDVPEQS